MKTNKKLAISGLATAFGFIIIIGSIRSDQAYAVTEKPDFLLPEGMNKFPQEKTRYKYLGLEKCASICHNNEEMGYQYDIVKSSPHSNAFKILISKKAFHYAKNANVTENPQASSVCLKCHVTGGGNDPSSFTSTYKREDGITCEACHKAEFISNTFLPKETDCLNCHNNSIHKTKKFNFKERSVKIDHSRPKVKAGTDITSVIEIPVNQYAVDGKSHYIGERYGGGIVFYTYNNGQHGLIAAITDQGKGIKWYNGINRFTGSIGDGVHAGEMNTSGIVSALISDDQTGSFAARVCADYSVNVEGITYSDWYLPSKSELNLLYLQKTVVGGFARGYWSSTEVDSLRAWTQYFDTGFQFSYGGKNYSGYVRAIRAF